MAYTDIPNGVNRDYYVSGRGRALYNLAGPLTTPAPAGSPVWWSNEGNRDAWQGLPSRVGVEAVFVDANGQPMPVRIGVPDPQTGLVPQSPYANAPPQPAGPWPPPNPGIVRIPAWADDYWTGYLWALQDPGTAVIRRGQGNVWTANYQKGLADGVARALPNDPTGFYPNAAQLAQSPVPIPRPAPVYVPPPPLPPPPMLPAPPPIVTFVTREIFGLLRGRPVPVYSILQRDGLLSHVRNGGRIAIGVNSSEGFGLGGDQSAWQQAAGATPPMNYGLPPWMGVVAWDGNRVRPLDGYTLQKMLGPAWVSQLQNAT